MFNKLKLFIKLFEVSCIEVWVGILVSRLGNYLFSKILGENFCNFKIVKLCF